MLFTGVEQHIAARLARVPEVEQVLINGSGDLLRVTSVIDTDDESVCDRIFDCEADIIRELHPTQFDFHVIARRGRPLTDVISVPPVWQRP